MRIVEQQLPTSRAARQLPLACAVGFAAGGKESCFAQTPAAWGRARINPSLPWPSQKSSGAVVKVCREHDGHEGSRVRSGGGFLCSARDSCRGSLALAAAPSKPAEVRFGLHYWVFSASMPICSNRNFAGHTTPAGLYLTQGGL